MSEASFQIYSFQNSDTFLDAESEKADLDDSVKAFYCLISICRVFKRKSTAWPIH